MKKINSDLYLEYLVLFLLLIPISSATVIDFQETYQDYNGNSHKYNGQNLGNYPLYSVIDNGDNYTISRFNISKDIPKQYVRNNITFNISYQFYPDRIVPSFQIDSYSQISDFVIKQNASAWYLPFPWKASQYISFTDDLIDMGVFKRTTKVTVLDSNGTEYQVLPKVTSNQIRLWFNPQTYSGVVYPLTITENTITVTNATTSGFTTSNITMNGTQIYGNGMIGASLNRTYCTGLVGNWNMLETEGTTVHNIDCTTGLINTTNQGTWFGNTTVNNTGEGILFDGVDDYVNVGNHASLNITENISVAAEIYNISAPAIQEAIINKFDGASSDNDAYRLDIHPGGTGRLLLRSEDGTLWNTSISPVSSFNTVMKLFGIYNGSSMVSYMNITAGTSVSKIDEIRASNHSVTIGSIDGIGAFFNGTIKNARIWNIDMSQYMPQLSTDPLIHYSNLTISNQSASLGNVINRTRIVISNTDANLTVDLYARQNGTSAWTAVQTNVTSNTWYSITDQYQAMDFDVRLNGNGSNTPFFTSLEWDELSNISSITNLTYTSTTSSINWTWTNPADVNFGSVMIYIDGVWIENVTSNYYLRYYEADRYHTLSTQTVSTGGVVNDTWVNNTGHTLVVTGGGIGSGGSSGGGVWSPEKPKYYTPDINYSNLSSKVTKMANQVQENVSNVFDVVNQNGTNIIILGIIVLAVIVAFIKDNKPYKFNKKK